MNPLLNGMNDRQAEAVKRQKVPLDHGGSWFWEDTCLDPPYRLLDR